MTFWPPGRPRVLVTDAWLANAGAGLVLDADLVLSQGATLEAQQRNIVDYVTHACVAALHGSPAPSLLPVPSRLSSRKPVRA